MNDKIKAVLKTRLKTRLYKRSPDGLHFRTRVSERGVTIAYKVCKPYILPSCSSPLFNLCENIAVRVSLQKF